MRAVIESLNRRACGIGRPGVVALAMLSVVAGGPVSAQQADVPAPAATSNRVALVIGDGAYSAGPLPAAANDAGLVAQVLAGAGFDVTGARDLDGEALRRAFRDFLDKAGAVGPDGIAVVYLAGRAVQQDGDNFFVPVDAKLARASDIPIETLRLGDFTRALAALPIQAKVVVVDGAYAGGPALGATPGAPGLALVEAEQGELVAFNAAPGTVAPATTGPYGVYAQALVQAMKQGGVPVSEVFDRVRLSVNQTTGGAVVPWDSDKLTRSFTFFDRGPGEPAVASAAIPFATLEKRPLREFPVDQAYDVALARDTLPAYTEFLTAFPNDPLARRVRLLVAVRREALFWRAAIRGGTPGAFWTYLSRYPRGPHAADAQRRLSRLAAAAAPPPNFAPLAFDVPPPPDGDVVVFDRPIVFIGPDLPPPPPPPVFLLPPPVEVVLVRPEPPAGRYFLPIPVPVPVPYVRPIGNPGVIVPPRGVPGAYARPRPFQRGPNGDGLVVEGAPIGGPPPQPPGQPRPGQVGQPGLPGQPGPAGQPGVPGQPGLPDQPGRPGLPGRPGRPAAPSNPPAASGQSTAPGPAAPDRPAPLPPNAAPAAPAPGAPPAPSPQSGSRGGDHRPNGRPAAAGVAKPDPGPATPPPALSVPLAGAPVVGSPTPLPVPTAPPVPPPHGKARPAPAPVPPATPPSGQAMPADQPAVVPPGRKQRPAAPQGGARPAAPPRALEAPAAPAPQPAPSPAPARATPSAPAPAEPRVMQPRPPEAQPAPRQAAPEPRLAPQPRQPPAPERPGPGAVPMQPGGGEPHPGPGQRRPACGHPGEPPCHP